MVQLSMSEFKDAMGKNLPETVLKVLKIPRQLLSANEKARIKQIGQMNENSIISAVSSNLAFSFFVQHNLQPIWDIVNGLQIIEKLQLFDAKVPANAVKMSSFFIAISNVKVFEGQELLGADELYLPELPPVSLNFQSFGYNTSLFLINDENLIQCTLILAIAILVFIILAIQVKLCKPCAAKCARDRSCFSRVFEILDKKTLQLGQAIFLSVTVRIFLEIYLDIVLLSAMNLNRITWLDFRSVKISNIMSIMTVILVSIAPLALFLSILHQRNQWDDSKFQRRAGSLLAETDFSKKRNRWSILLVPFIFLARRVMLAISVIIWTDCFAV